MQNIFKKFEKIHEFEIKRRNLPHWQQPGGVYFLTFRTNHLILNDIQKDIVHNHILKHNKSKYILYSFVIMPDHVHLVLQPLDLLGRFYSLAEIMQSIKGGSSREINIKFNSTGFQNWQKESFDRIIRNEKEFNEKLEYIKNNPVKNGLIDNGLDYKWFFLYSSNPNN
jgi:REP element-mobilizing transposase RayT